MQFLTPSLAVAVVALVLRAALGSFFLISGYHKLFSPARRASLAETFKADGCYNPAMMWVIPLGEFFGGAALLLGVLVPVASTGLIAICLGACVFDGVKRIKGWKPLDAADAMDDVLYLPEVLYIVMLMALIAVGSGPYSADALAVALLG